MTDDDAIPQPELRLDQFLKLSSLADTGGQAKLLIQSGKVRVNGETETRRGRKLLADDIVEARGKRYSVKQVLAG